MSVYKPKTSRFFHYDFQYQNRRFCGSTNCETRRQAEAVERRKRGLAAQGLLDDDDILTLHQACSKWWTEHAQDLGSSAHVWRRIGISLRLLGKNTLVTDLTTAKVEAAIQKRRRETYVKSKKANAKRYPVQPATVNADIVGIVRRVLKWAAKDEDLAAQLRPIRWGELILAEPEPQLRIYTPDQQDAWLGECDPAARLCLRLLLTYGLRFGELLFPPDAYLPSMGDPTDPEDGPILHLTGRKGDLEQIVPLRQDDARAVAARAGRALAAGLDRIWFEQDEKGDLVPMTYYGIQARLRSAAKRAGLTMPRLIHGARHHAGTTILRETQNLKAAQQLLGHRDIKSTMRYAQVLTKDLRAALEGKSRNSPEPETAEAEFTPQKQRRKKA